MKRRLLPRLRGHRPDLFDGTHRLLHQQGRRDGLDRRTVLRGLLQGAAVTVGLPPLLAMTARPARAASCNDGLPRRFVMFFWGNGNRPEYWTPTGEGTEWALSEELAALAPYKSKVSVVSGMSVKAPNVIPHWSGAIGFLTGQAPDGVDGDWDVAGPTVDQLLAQEIGGDTIYRSLEVGVETDKAVSWAGRGAQYPTEEDPYAFYERIFGASFREPGSDAEPDPSIGYRRSVLDAVVGDINTLKGRVGAEDQLRLERHFDGIRELETRLARLQEDPPSLEACARPDAPAADYPDNEGRPDVPGKARAMSDLLAMALACDQTRVASMFMTYPVKNVLFDGISDGHHTLTHNEPTPQPQVHEITLQIMDEYAYLLGALDAIPEGEGTLLDHCCVLGTSDTSEGRVHSLDEFPIVLAGGACGALKTGVHYRSYAQENANKVLLSVMRGMGMVVDSFGAGDSYTTDGLSAIEG
jgi:hypothetical protein